MRSSSRLLPRCEVAPVAVDQAVDTDGEHLTAVDLERHPRKRPLRHTLHERPQPRRVVARLMARAEELALLGGIRRATHVLAEHAVGDDVCASPDAARHRRPMSSSTLAWPVSGYSKRTGRFTRSFDTRPRASADTRPLGRNRPGCGHRDPGGAGAQQAAPRLTCRGCSSVVGFTDDPPDSRCRAVRAGPSASGKTRCRLRYMSTMTLCETSIRRGAARARIIHSPQWRPRDRSRCRWPSRTSSRIRATSRWRSPRARPPAPPSAGRADRRSRPICTCHLEEALVHSQPQISKHLAVLRRAGLAESRREGRWVYYSLSRPSLDAARDFLDQLEELLAEVRAGRRVRCRPRSTLSRWWRQPSWRAIPLGAPIPAPSTLRRSTPAYAEPSRPARKSRRESRGFERHRCQECGCRGPATSAAERG